MVLPKIIKQGYYGDTTRWFVGTVVNATPPAGFEGRVRVRIHGIHSESTVDIPERDLPWAQVVLPTTEGGVSGIGRPPQLVAGALVFGVFLDGRDSQSPLVIGSMPHDEFPTSLQKYTPRYGVSERQQNTIIKPVKDDELVTADLQLRRLQSMEFFLDNGYRPIHAAGITGVLEDASNFNIGAHGDDVFGIGAWKTKGDIVTRYNNLRTFAVSYTPALIVQTFSFQLQFVLYELRNDLSIANRRLLSTTNIKDAATVMQRYYVTEAKGNVMNKAQQAYDEVFV